MRATEKSITVSDADGRLAEIVREVAASNDSVILKVDGEEKAAVMPLALYLQYLKSRQAVSDRLQKIAERVNMPEEEANALIEEAIKSVRSGSG